MASPVPVGTPSRAAQFPIPPELERFLRVPGPRIVFVRGPEGTGKAAIAARILQEWGEGSAWVGTRGSEDFDPAGVREHEGSKVTRVDLSWAGTLTEGRHDELVAARDAVGGYLPGARRGPPDR